MKDNCQHNSFCCSLNEDVRNRLCRACLRLHLKPKQELLFDKSATQVAIINEGVIISILFAPGGEQKCAELLRPGELLGASLLFHPWPEQTGYMLALNDVMVCLFPVEVFETFFQQIPEFSKAVLQSLSARMHKSLRHRMLMQSSTSEEKIRTVLDFLKGEGVNTSYITHEDLAFLADLNRVTVTRAIKSIHKLAHKGN